MSEHQSRIYKIINEITNYMLKAGSKNCSISIEKVDKSVYITLVGRSVVLSSNEIQELEDALSIQRQQPVEEYLWELAGENENYDELNLVGMMIDESKIKYDDGCLTITVIRREDGEV
ncbi:hypothetical protein F8154_09760 [Alkaliphilus pronyensis]|uniref:DUF2294 family protein n=1 Tax=Alkaliphilus pronyensis TaxID=1482732 RepID=A0A6I0EXW0_9FIRM|nr:hypothetical protein [Alkaliphilus pronyensis]KAB3534111.1 hypothetical protein F8154_09760 [Alkaliphilus pronyensis]